MDPTTIDGLFDRQVAARPDAVAVTAHDGRLRYAELDTRSAGVAGRLRRFGVRPGDVVAVDVPRGAGLVVLLLGILRAGAAYLVLDARSPAARRRVVLSVAGAVVLVTADPADDGRAALAPAALLDHGEPGDLPEVTSGEHVAYVAFTSGSTGTPKGVCIPHRAVARLAGGAGVLRIGPDDVFLQHSPVAFDASTLELWAPLCTGGRLAVAPPHDLSPAGLAAFVRREGVTVLWLTAGLFHHLRPGDLDDLRGLRYLLAGGDVLAPAVVNRTASALPDTVLVNGYGPTENTTFTCCHPVSGPVGAAVPIGTPVDGTEVRVLDDRLHPVRPGEVGELYAAGAGLAHGYLGSPALTSARFVPDPFSTTPGARLYRTGDLVRHRTDGTLEFVGRRDGQVKIRGFRVETGEVESALTALPAVYEAAVVAVPAGSGERRLVGYVVPTDPTACSTVRLRRRLAGVLPAYAVPDLLRPVDALPLTATGKLDRAALGRLPTAERPDVAAAYREPVTPVERFVADLWGDHLGIVGIGADDDFFELGGHSLLAVTVIDALLAEFDVAVSPLDFYRDPSAAGLARVIERTAAAL